MTEGGDAVSGEIVTTLTVQIDKLKQENTAKSKLLSEKEDIIQQLVNIIDKFWCISLQLPYAFLFSVMISMSLKFVLCNCPHLTSGNRMISNCQTTLTCQTTPSLQI